MPGTVVGTEDGAVTKTSQASCPQVLTFCLGWRGTAAG